MRCLLFGIQIIAGFYCIFKKLQIFIVRGIGGEGAGGSHSNLEVGGSIKDMPILEGLIIDWGRGGRHFSNFKKHPVCMFPNKYFVFGPWCS